MATPFFLTYSQALYLSAQEKNQQKLSQLF